MQTDEKHGRERQNNTHATLSVKNLINSQSRLIKKRLIKLRSTHQSYV